jgi:hypothetical protein
MIRVRRMEEKRNIYKMFVVKPERKIPGELGADG